jgi:hypothetical protein
LLWFALCLIASRLLFKIKVNLFIYIFIAWLFLDFIFLQNINQKNNWALENYNSREKRLPDDELNKLALQVKSLLGLSNNKIDKIKNNKVLILSSDRYQRARLIFHMLPANSSFLDEYMEKSAITNLQSGDYILSYDTANNPQRPSAGTLQINQLTLKVKEIAHGSHFSIMKVEND